MPSKRSLKTLKVFFVLPKKPPVGGFFIPGNFFLNEGYCVLLMRYRGWDKVMLSECPPAGIIQFCRMRY